MARPHVERALVRLLVGAALALAVWACAWVPIPQDAQGDSDLPALAFGQAGLYRLEVALLVFYCGLLLLTPAFSGLVRGRLPIEISARGAKFAEGADDSARLSQMKIEQLEQTTTHLAEGLLGANLKIDQLRQQLGEIRERR